MKLGTLEKKSRMKRFQEKLRPGIESMDVPGRSFGLCNCRPNPWLTASLLTECTVALLNVGAPEDQLLYCTQARDDLVWFDHCREKPNKNWSSRLVLERVQPRYTCTLISLSPATAISIASMPDDDGDDLLSRSVQNWRLAPPVLIPDTSRQWWWLNQAQIYPLQDFRLLLLSLRRFPQTFMC